MNDEDAAISSLTGFALGSLISDVSAADISSRLGLAGLVGLTSSEIYNDNYGGSGTGIDYEGQVDLDMAEEDSVADETEDRMDLDMHLEPAVKQKKMKKIIVRRPIVKPKNVYELFPSYDPKKPLNFPEILRSRIPAKSRIWKRPLHVEVVPPKRKVVPSGYLRAIVGDARREVETKRVEQVVAAGSIDDDLKKALKARQAIDADPIQLRLDDRSFDLVLLSNWEEQIIYSPTSVPKHQPAPRPSLTTPTNTALESGIWTQSIIWDSQTPFRDFTQLEVHEKDEESQVIEEASARATEAQRAPARVGGRRLLRTAEANAASKDKFNLSNDHMYEVAKEGRRVRQTFGQLEVQHAYPALKLQMPFYKTRLTKQEARSWHRPPVNFPTGIELRFSKVRTAKKKKDKNGRKPGKGGEVLDALKTTADLTLKDTSTFVLWEYSEEHPATISSYGMGSILVNYYRKRDDKDEHIPKLDLGTPFLLEPGDDTPFLKFGSVAPGQTIPTLYNNLVRAPLFRHKPYTTDFLLIKSTHKGESKYYIREIKNLFVVGQTYPVQEVPGPHSRKITTTMKHRLQQITYKLLKKSVGERLKIARLMKYFPDQNELQMRQRLKDWMEYNRKGPHQGFWRLKDPTQMPDEAGILKLLTPEQVVLSEAMQVGQRHLMDSGYGQAAASEEGGDGGGDESKLDVEQQLAPWLTTKNFLQATQAKAMLKLHGEGDPTGRGEAFSFIRVSMKEIFVKADEDWNEKMAEADNRPKSAHRYNVAQQQQVYRSEIERIWQAQFKSLSRKDEPQLTEEELREFNKANEAARRPKGRPRMFGDGGTPRPFYDAGTPRPSVYEGGTPRPFLDGPYSPSAMSPAAGGYGSGPASPAFSRGSSMDRDMSVGPNDLHYNKVLRVKRLVDGQWKTEIIRDPAVIKAYVRRRQLIEEQNIQAEAMAPTGDAEKDARMKQLIGLELARMKKNQERRLNRKNQKIIKEGGTPLPLKRPPKPDTTRRCGHCGQIGHMKTNRKCPRWAEFNSGQITGAIPTPAASSPAAGGSGSGTMSPTSSSLTFGYPGVPGSSGSSSGFQPVAASSSSATSFPPQAPSSSNASSSSAAGGVGLSLTPPGSSDGYFPSQGLPSPFTHRPSTTFGGGFPGPSPLSTSTPVTGFNPSFDLDPALR